MTRALHDKSACRVDQRDLSDNGRCLLEKNRSLHLIKARREYANASLMAKHIHLNMTYLANQVRMHYITRGKSVWSLRQGSILSENNLTLCKADYFETCWCPLNVSVPTTCPYLLRHVVSLSNSSSFCLYHTIRQTIECFKASLIFPPTNSASGIYISSTLILFLLGLLGNGLSMIILFGKTLRPISVYRNLFILCGLNIFYLLAVLIRHTNLYRQDLRLVSFDFCRYHTFLVAFTGHLCSWQLVSTSIQRVHALLSLQSHRGTSWVSREMRVNESDACRLLAAHVCDPSAWDSSSPVAPRRPTALQVRSTEASSSVWSSLQSAVAAISTRPSFPDQQLHAVAQRLRSISWTARQPAIAESVQVSCLHPLEHSRHLRLCDHSIRHHSHLQFNHYREDLWTASLDAQLRWHVSQQSTSDTRPRQSLDSAHRDQLLVLYHDWPVQCLVDCSIDPQILFAPSNGGHRHSAHQRVLAGLAKLLSRLIFHLLLRDRE